MTPAGQLPCASASGVAYNRVAPASSAARALKESATNAHTSTGDTAETAPHAPSRHNGDCFLCDASGSEREAYGARIALSNAAHASARTLCTAEKAMPHSSSSSTSYETASKGDPPMRPTWATRSSRVTARVTARSTTNPLAEAVATPSCVLRHTSKGSPRRARTRTDTARLRGISLSAAEAPAFMASSLRITRTSDPISTGRAVLHVMTSPARASSAACDVRN